MGTNAKQFFSELYKMKKGINTAVSDVIKGVVDEVFTALREDPTTGGTPVLTGWARSGWRVNIGSPTPGEVGSDGNVSASDAEAESSLNSFLGMNNLTNVGKIFIDNRVPYIAKLNANNRQSGTHFVEKSIQRGSTKLAENRNITKY